MAELKNTLVSGSLAARKIYENGTALENKFGASLGLSGSKIQLKDYSGKVISEVTLPSATPKFDGGGATINSSSTSATASGLTITDTDTDPGSGVYITTSGSATPRRAAVLYNGAVNGWVNVADNTSALSAANGSATTLSSNKYYVTELSVNSGKVFPYISIAGHVAEMECEGYIDSFYGNMDTFNDGEVDYVKKMHIGMIGNNDKGIAGELTIDNVGHPAELGCKSTLTVRSNLESTINIESNGTNTLNGTINVWGGKTADRGFSIEGRAITGYIDYADINTFKDGEIDYVEEMNIGTIGNPNSGINGVLNISKNGDIVDSGALGEINITNNYFNGIVNVVNNYFSSSTGTVNINGGKTANGGVSVEGKVVTVDGDGTNAGTAVTNSSGDLITGKATQPTATQTGASASLSGTTITLTKSVTPDVSAGWISAGTAGSLKMSGTVPTEEKTVTPTSSAQVITPTSGKLLSKVTVNAATGSSITAASGFSLAITDKSTTDITVGTVSSGYYPLTASLTGTFTASTAGYFSSGSATDSSVIVGRIAAATHTHSGGGLTGGGLTSGSGSVTSSGLTLSSTNTSGISVSGSGSVTRAAVTRAAVECTETAGYVPGGKHTCLAADSSTIGQTSKSSSTATKYVTDLSLGGKTLNSITLTASSSANSTLTTLKLDGYSSTYKAKIGTLNFADSYNEITTVTGSGTIKNLGSSAANVAGSLTITNNGGSSSSYKTSPGTITVTNNGTGSGSTKYNSGTVTVTKNTFGTVNVWGTSGDKTVQVAGHTVTVDGTAVTNSSGDLTTTSRSAGTTTIAPVNITLSDTSNGISISAYGSVSTGTGWISSGSTSSTSLTQYITGVTVPKDTAFSVGMTADTAVDETSNLTITNAAYRTISINGGGNQGVKINGANGKTAIVDGTTVTDANGDLITTSRSAGTGYVRLVPGNGSASISGNSNVTLSSTNNGIAVTATGSGSVSGTGYGEVSTGTGWITTGTKASTISDPSAADSNEATETKYITGVTVPKDKTFSVTMTADTAADTTSNLTITNAAYRTVSVNGGGNQGVKINGAKGKTAIVDGTTVTDANGDLTTTSRSAGTTTIAPLNVTLSDTNNGISISAYGSVSTGTGWISSGSTSSTTLTKYVTAISVPKDKTFSVTMSADTTLDATSNLTITNAAYRNVSVTNAANGTVTVNGGGDKGVLINGANGKTVKVDNVTVTDANGDLITATITANNPTVSPTHGAVTPSVGGTVTSVATTSQPSGTDGTDYLTIDPGASIAIQPKATPSYTYSATAGYTSAISSTTKTGSATNITPSVNDGTNYYLPKKTPKFDGGSGSGGGLTWDSNNVTLNDTNNDIYVKVTRAAVTRAAVLYNGAVNGWVNVSDNATALASGTALSSTSSTKYISDINIPSTKKLNSLSGEGNIGVLGGYISAETVEDGSEFTVLNNDGNSFGLFYENHEGQYQFVDGGVILEAGFGVSGRSVICNSEGWVTSGATAGSIAAGSVTQPTATQTGASASLSGTTITLSKSITPSVTKAGYISSGTAGTLKMSGTVPTETKTVTASTSSQTIKPSSGKLFSQVTVNAVSATTTGNTILIGDDDGSGIDGFLHYVGASNMASVGFVVRAIASTTISDPTCNNCSYFVNNLTIGPWNVKTISVYPTAKSGIWSVVFNGKTYGGTIIDHTATGGGGAGGEVGD